ncbi:MAG: metal-dependent hydrolase [Planctomycetota bacterium]
MPSPIAHTSLLLIAVPPLRERLLTLTPTRRRLFMLWLAFALLAPDLDLLLGLLTGQGLRPLHGGPTHSLLLAPLFGLIWMIPGRVMTQSLFRYRTLFGWAAAAYASHVALDFVTPGRGIGVLWPLPIGDQPGFSLNAHRVGSPIPLFVGVDHSNWRNVGHHALTLVTELAFAVLMLGIGRALARSQAQTNSQAKPTQP